MKRGTGAEAASWAVIVVGLICLVAVYPVAALLAPLSWWVLAPVLMLAFVASVWVMFRC